MTRCEAIKAFREVASEEFAHIPNENEIEYEFSERFNRKMEKFLDKIEYNSTHSISKSKRYTLTLIAAIIMLFVGLISVSAIREPIVNFIIEKYETFVEFSFSGDTSKHIEYEYGFSELPSGFKEIVYQVAEGSIYKEYLNEQTTEIISLYQTVTDANKINLDNEQGEIITESINGSQVYIYKHNNNDYIQANWISKTYSIILTYHGDIETDEFVNLIKSIE